MIFKNIHFLIKCLFLMTFISYFSINLYSQDITIVTEQDATYEKDQTAKSLLLQFLVVFILIKFIMVLKVTGKHPVAPLFNSSITLNPNSSDTIEYSINDPGVISCRLDNDRLNCKCRIFSFRD